MNKSPVDPTLSVAQRIDARIQSLPDWQAKLLKQLRKVILAADASLVEEWKWNVPVWSSGGVICTGETYKQVVKLTFANGASLPDPAGLFNSSLDGKVRRAIDFREGSEVNGAALAQIIRSAVDFNHKPAS